jgi:hypothetical protein
MNDPLTKAIALIGAVEVAPGRYAFPARTITRQPQNTVTYEAWHVADKRALIEIIVHAAALSTVGAVEMPSWWSPEHRAVWRSGARLSFTTEKPADNRAWESGPPWIRFTASLETGAEVPA